MKRRYYSILFIVCVILAIIGVGISKEVKNSVAQKREARKIEQENRERKLENEQKEKQIKEDLSEYNYTLENKLIDFQVCRKAGTKYLDTLRHDHHISELRTNFYYQLRTDYNKNTNSLVISDRISNKGTKAEMEEEIIGEYNLVKNIKINDEIGPPSSITIKVYITDGNYNIIEEVAEYKDDSFILNKLDTISIKGRIKKE